MSTHASGSIMDHVVRIPDAEYRGGDDSSDSDSDSDSDAGGRRTVAKSVVVAVAIVLIIVIIYSTCFPKILASKLANRGWLLVSRDDCGYCKKQLAVLGGSYSKVAKCTPSGFTGTTEKLPFECEDVPGFPYWFNTRNGATKVGFQDKKALKGMATA